MNGMVGWPGPHVEGERPCGVHPWALVGAPPEMRGWTVGDPMVAPDVHPSALVDAFCTVDAGMPGMVTTTIGPRTWLQKRVHVGHNVVIGADCEICVGVVLCGEVTVGDSVKIAGNTWVKPRVRIGDGAVIGGSSVVTRDVPAHEVWCGNPARFLKLAWTHPSATNRGQYDMTDEQWGQAMLAAEHPYRDREETWQHMRPWHHRADTVDGHALPPRAWQTGPERRPHPQGAGT